MQCFFPAQATGDTLVAVLTNKGNSSSPTGRLPITWPRFASQIPPIVNYSMAGRAYRYMETDPLYPFVYGLSYTNFSYDLLAVEYFMEPKCNVSFGVFLTNTGIYDADEVIQCYINWINQGYFNRVNILAGGYVLHNFEIAWENWAYWNDTQWAVQTGDINLSCGGQQPFQKKTAPSNVLSLDFPVFGDEMMDRVENDEHEFTERRIKRLQVTKEGYNPKFWE